MVVDDNAVIGMLLARTLTSMGHEICAVETTQDDAVAAAARYRPDLMIVDVALGQGSGIAAVEEVLRTRHVPHIFMSGAPIQAGTRGRVVLAKPFDEAELALAIADAAGTPTAA
nr:response regulator [Neoroseomonas nitratireducens]